MPAERWLPIEGWPYEVSDHGRVRHAKTKRVRRLGLHKNGYLRVDLYDAPRRSPSIMVHHLVAVAFIGPSPGPIGCGADEYQINHRDGSGTNNRPRNIEWVTGAENNAHAARMGLKAHGERHWNATLTAASVRKIRLRLRAGDRHRHIARDFGVSHQSITSINTGRRWRHVA